MHRSTGASEPRPARTRKPPPSSLPDSGPGEEVWFEVDGRDGRLTGTSSRVVHDRPEPGGTSVRHEWEYKDLRSLHVLDGGDGGSIVIEPIHGPLVPVPIAPEHREEAFQAATVFALLIARAHRLSPIRAAVPR
jgi:hypothetical protein